jgi:hypothetical protein
LGAGGKEGMVLIRFLKTNLDLDHQDSFEVGKKEHLKKRGILIEAFKLVVFKLYGRQYALSTSSQLRILCLLRISNPALRCSLIGYCDYIEYTSRFM